MRRRRIWLVLCSALLGALTLCLTTAAAEAATSRTSGDAYATVGANDCTWTMGTAGIEKVVTLSSGSFTMTSLKNKVASPAVETVQGTTASDEFRFSWDGTTLRGSSGSWTCASGAANVVTVGGENAIQVDVELARSTVHVLKHYVIYPSTALIREWTEYKNSDSSAHTLATPSYLEERMLGNDVANEDLMHMSGASVDGGDGSYTVYTSALSSTWERPFDSYDSWACAKSTSSGACGSSAWAETSKMYMPWFALHNRSRDDGVYFGFDYHGRWSTDVGYVDRAQTDVSMTLPNYSASVAAGATVTMPKAFTAMYSGDLDDMTNRLLDWQYRYMWDDTRSDYFAGIRLVADWGPGAHPFAGYGGPYDPTALLQKVFGYAERMREIGGDGYHRDTGWYYDMGDWRGPDWKQSIAYLAKSGMRQTIYYPAYDANTTTPIYAAHPSWYVNGSPCGYADRLADLSIPAAATSVYDTVSGNADAWGDYAWRNDSCPVGNVTGATQLGESAAFMDIQQRFLDAHPGSAVQGVDSGGYEINYEFVHRASSLSFTDLNGLEELQSGGSRLFPVDKLSGTGGNWPVEYCDTTWNMLLVFNPEFVNDPGSTTAIDCMRRLLEKYHYLKANGVVGRWVHQYHPTSSLNAAAWFQRVSQDQTKSLLVYSGEPNTHTRTCYPVTICPDYADYPGTTPAGNVTVYPKGLDPTTRYTITFELTSGLTTRTGSDIMTNGITLSSPQAGELIWLGMEKHPGGGNDTTAPTAPASVTATYATNMGHSGVEITWPAGTDDNYVDRYEVFRDGVKIATVSKGRYHFDHSPAASTSATYGVRTVDGDGNTSSTTTTTPTAADRTAVDDASGSLTYTGTWTHATGQTYPYAGTLSSTDTAGSAVAYDFTGSGITLYAKLGPDQGKMTVLVDGRDETVVDLYSPDDDNYQMDVFARTWSSRGPHTITVERSGRKNVNSTSTQINVDGLQVRTTQPDTIDDSAFTYTGAGWKRPHDGWGAASDETFTASSTPELWDQGSCHSACQGFTSTQGAYNWSYEDNLSGTWTAISTFTTVTSEDAWHDAGTPAGGVVWADKIHPGQSNDTARTWTAPRPGTIDIASHVAKVDPNGNGVVVKITKNGTTIAGPVTLAGDDRSGSDLNATGVTVASGDKIRFEINNNGDWSNDTTYWDPDVQYRGDATCNTACQGFGGRQGQSNWRYQDYRSGSWTDIGGFQLRNLLLDGPAWHDSSPTNGGYVFRQYIHPGDGVATARAWVAPKAGTIDIASTPAKVDPGGNGVVVQITKNGTAIAGPRTIPYNDTTGSAMNVTGVSVAAGDVIRFEISDNGAWSNDMTRWDPSIAYTGSTCNTACQGFSSTQGSMGWHYQDSRDGTWMDIENFVPRGLPAGDTWHDDTPTVGGYLLQAIQHPGTAIDSARAWVAPMTGTIDISSQPYKSDTGGGDGVVVRVTKNGQTILGPRTIAYNDATGSAFNVTGVSVVAGDVIRFEINRNGNWYFDSTAWDPTIGYTAAGAPPSPTWDTVSGTGAQYAEVSVTGSDVELIGRRCTSCGPVDISVDGTWVARVDTYSWRGPETWQAPLWHYSWPTSGTHTIRMTPVGTASLDSTGATVLLDGLQIDG